MRRVALVALSVVVVVVLVRDRSNDLREIASARAALNDGVLRTVIMGDSVARGAGDERGIGIAGWLDQQFRQLGIRAESVVNLGINGARTFNVRALLRQSAAQSAVRASDVVIISIGGNDLYGDTRARILAGLIPDHHQKRVVANVANVVSNVRALNPAAHIYLLGLYNPYRKAWLDAQVNQWDARLIERFASARDITVVRIHDLLRLDHRISSLDRFHPSTTGYAAIASRIASSMECTTCR